MKIDIPPFMVLYRCPAKDQKFAGHFKTVSFLYYG